MSPFHWGLFVLFFVVIGSLPFVLATSVLCDFRKDGGRKVGDYYLDLHVKPESHFFSIRMKITSFI